MRYMIPPLLLLLGFTLVPVMGCGLGNDMEATILFDSADGLEAGDLVLHKGFTIGTVRSVDLKKGEGPARSQVHVRVAFEEEYADLLYHQMLFAVERDRLFGSERHIEVYERAVKHPVLVRDGDLIIGSTQADRYLGWAKDHAMVLLEEAGDFAAQAGLDADALLDAIGAGLEQHLSKEELEDLLTQLESAKEEAGDQAQVLLEQLEAYLKSRSE